MGRPRRRGAVRGSSVEGLASRIPSMLRTFAPSTDPQTFREHLGAISAMAEMAWSTRLCRWRVCPLRTGIARR